MSTSHHISSKGTTLVARSTSRRLQAGHVHVQDVARPDTTVLVGRLSADLSASRRLRSSDTFTFAVLPTRTRVGDRSFAVAGPQIWNCLPADLSLVDNNYYACFRRLLKGHMFG